MRRRTLVALVLVVLLIVGRAPKVAADQGGGVVQLEGGIVKYLEGLFPEPLGAELPGGRQFLLNPDGWWAECHVGLPAVEGWYVYMTDGGSIRQPGGALQFWGTWNHWVEVPELDPSRWYFVELPEEGVGAGWTEGWWSGTFFAVAQMDRPYAQPPYSPTNYPQYKNMSFTIQGHGHGVWEGWTIHMDSHIKDGDIMTMRWTGNITPPRT